MIPAKAAPEEIVNTRLFHAPRELVFRAWTDLEHLSRWWGPNGFRTTTRSRDFAVGGAWLFTMHGPDGTDYPNRITYREIVPNEFIRFDHDDGSDDENAHRFLSSVRFDAVGQSTLVTMRARFSSIEACEAAKKYGQEGGRQTLGRFAALLDQLTNTEAASAFVVSRVFDAPRELVWRMYSEAAHLTKWFGPQGLTMERYELDFQPGGVFHYGMKTPDQKMMWGKWTFLEITPEKRLVILTSFSDQNQGVTRHPMSENWPLLTLSESTFEEEDGKTHLTMRAFPFGASELEEATFAQNHAGMNVGFRGTFDQLDTYLSQHQSSLGTIALNRLLQHPPARVWQALTDPEKHAKWWAAGDVRAVVGHHFELDMGPWGKQACEVTAVEPERLLQYRFATGSLNTTITWKLHPEGSGTRLSLTHAGFDLQSVMGMRSFEGMKNGWPNVFERLETMLSG